MSENFNIAKSQLFKKGDRFRHINCGTLANKLGTVNYLRDDSTEQASRKADSTHYYYSVTFDDGTFETYLGQMYMTIEVK
jgi:hypothetical protein